MKTLKNSLNWFEIPVSDFDRAKKFYSDIYEYDMPTTQMGETTLGFLLVEQGGIGGAIAYGPDYSPGKEGALIYLNGGEDLNSVLKNIEPAGGEIISNKAAITAELGYMAVFIDTEGNKVALHSMK